MLKSGVNYDIDAYSANHRKGAFYGEVKVTALVSDKVDGFYHALLLVKPDKKEIFSGWQKYDSLAIVQFEGQTYIHATAKWEGLLPIERPHCMSHQDFVHLLLNL